MSCLLDKGLTSICGPNIGGTKEIYITNYEEIASFTEDEDGSISAISFGTSGGKFLEFASPTGLSFFGSPATINGANRYMSPFVDVTVSGLDQDRFNALEKLLTGKFVVVMKNYKQQKFILGIGNGLEASTAEVLAPAGAGDTTGIHFVLTGVEETFMKVFTGNIAV